MPSGGFIKRFRKERNMSQEELAQKLNVTRSVVAHYETGRRNPKQETLQKIAVVLGVPVYWLVYGPPGESSDIRNFKTEFDSRFAEIQTKGLSPDEAAKEARKLSASLGNEMFQEVSKGLRTLEEWNSFIDYTSSEISGRLWNDQNKKRNELIFSLVDELNDLGRKEAIHQLELLRMIPDYQKENDDTQMIEVSREELEQFKKTEEVISDLFQQAAGNAEMTRKLERYFGGTPETFFKSDKD